MLIKLTSQNANPGKTAAGICTFLVIFLFALITVIIFPVLLLNNAPEPRVIEGLNGYASLNDDSDSSEGVIFKLRGEWEFYPNKLYSFNDFTSGKVDEVRVTKVPHFWKHEQDDVIENAAYATYRMRVRVPSSFSGIGIYSRFQYSAYEVFLNDELICGAGVVSEDFNLHESVFLPRHGYTYSAIGSEGRTFSIIVHVQNAVSDSGGLANDILIGSAGAVQNLRTLLLTINGLVSGGLLLLFLCFLLIYLNGKERKEYLYYTIVALVVLFISLTYGGESLMYSIGIDSVFLARLEYCAIITGSFFANYSVLSKLFKTQIIFNIIRIYTISMTIFFLLVPMFVFSAVKVPVMAISFLCFLLPFIKCIKDVSLKRDISSFTSLFSYIIVFVGIYFFAFGGRPWDSIDIFSITIMIHCILQMIMFLHRYRNTEQVLKEMTETLEERITERTFELIQMKEKAEAAATAKSNFLANMSHEIRTPMNAVMGICDLMRTDNLDDIQLNYLSDIKKSSKALLYIINDILDFTKIEAGKLEIIPVHFNLVSVLDNICSLCSFSAGDKKLDFRYYFAPDIPKYIYCDEVRFRQIVLNIISNAVKYTKEGFVFFKVEQAVKDGTKFLVLTVEDTGIGIKKEDFPKLFHSFEQLDGKSNRKIVGTGLGLSITKQLVTLMNGSITFKSEYGKGSSFTITLPLTEGDGEKADIQQDDYVPVTSKDAKVLVVDDNQINLTVASGFLELHCIKPDTASSGAEAIEKIKSNEYDLVFMDHMMPEMDGIEATGIIRTMENGRFAGLPIIALTANAIAGAKDVFIEAGMNGFLSKPIEAKKMNNLLKNWLPKEKISGEAIVQTHDGNVNSGIIDKLSKIEELNVNKGVKYAANNITLYLSMIKQFCIEFDNYLSDVADNFEKSNWTYYTIKVHAMKGVFANLGAEKLSGWAFKLENASRNGDYPLCVNETTAFCESMRSFYDKLIATGLLEKDNTYEKIPIDAIELKQTLEELKLSCMTGDCNNAEEIQKELCKKSFSDKIDMELDEVYSLINSFDFEIAAQKIDNVLAKL